MKIKELIEKIKKSSKTRTPEKRKQLLCNAHILNENGHYDERFFSKETVEKSRKK